MVDASETVRTKRPSKSYVSKKEDGHGVSVRPRNQPDTTIEVSANGFVYFKDASKPGSLWGWVYVGKGGHINVVQADAPSVDVRNLGPRESRRVG